MLPLANANSQLVVAPYIALHMVEKGISCIYIYIYGMPNIAMVSTRLIVVQRLFPI